MGVVMSDQNTVPKTQRWVKATPAWRIVGAVARHLTLLVFAIICLFPYVWLLLSSFKNSSEILQIPPTFFPRQPSLASYRTILFEFAFGRAFLNSLLVTSVSTLLVLYTASSAGYVFAKYRFRGKDLIFLALLSTLMIPFAAVLIPLFLQVSSFGWIDSFQGLIVPTIYTTFGIFIMRQFIEGIPSELIDAGRIDGASEFWIYARIILPLSASSLAILGLLHFFAIWDSFLWPLSIVNTPSLRTLPIAIAGLNSERGARYDLQLAASVLANVPILLLYMVAQRRLSRGVALTGSKM